MVEQAGAPQAAPSQSAQAPGPAASAGLSHFGGEGGGQAQRLSQAEIKEANAPWLERPIEDDMSQDAEKAAGVSADGGGDRAPEGDGQPAGDAAEGGQEAGESQPEGPPRAPAGLTKEEMEAWEGLPDDAKKALARIHASMDTDYRKKTQALAEFKPVLEDPEQAAIIRYALANSDLGESMAQLITAHARAQGAGQQFDPSQVFQAAKGKGDQDYSAELERVAAMSDEDLQDAMLTDPKIFRGLVQQISAMRQPIAQLRDAGETARRATDLQAELEGTLQALGEKHQMKPEDYKEIHGQVVSHLEANHKTYAKLGFPPKTQLALAFQSALAQRQTAEAREEGRRAAESAKADSQKRDQRVSLPPTNAPGQRPKKPTPETADDDAFGRLSGRGFPFDERAK